MLSDEKVATMHQSGVNSVTESSPTNGAARRPKTTPKKGRDERFDEQKRALQRMTMVALAHGRRHGLEADDVAALEEALRTLGWLPSDLKL